MMNGQHRPPACRFTGQSQSAWLYNLAMNLPSWAAVYAATLTSHINGLGHSSLHTRLPSRRTHYLVWPWYSRRHRRGHACTHTRLSVVNWYLPGLSRWPTNLEASLGIPWPTKLTGQSQIPLAGLAEHSLYIQRLFPWRADLSHTKHIASLRSQRR